MMPSFDSSTPGSNPVMTSAGSTTSACKHGLLVTLQGVMTVSEALMIPPAGGGTPGSNPSMLGQAQQMRIPTGLSPQYSTQTAWAAGSNDWPLAGTSIGRNLATSPGLYGRSVDMVDVCQQLMDAGTGHAHCVAAASYHEGFPRADVMQVFAQRVALHEHVICPCTH